MAERAASTGKSARKRTTATTEAPAATRATRAVGGLLPAVSPAQAAALRSFFSAPQTWSLSNGGLLQFVPGRPAPAAQTFEIDAEGTRIGLCLQHPAHGDGPHWSDYQGRSRVLAWSLAHETQLMRLSEAFGVVLTPIADACEAAADGTSLLWLDFIVDEDAPEGSTSRMPALQGALRLPAAWSERLLERADPPGDTGPQLDGWRALGVPIRLQWRIAPLPWADWSGLRPGDVLVVGRRSQPPASEACAHGLAWPLEPATGGWRVSGPPRHFPTNPQDTSPMSDSTHAGDAGTSTDPDALARRLPVEVSFELGRTELRVGELSALQPGYVFPLAGALEGANVTIRANGQAVGQGEVVAVGDTLGVRLLGWS
ncbi:type III secretion system cytoplasmic ring protein SctQ [Luteimonas sp. SDU101]|uniref:type III secretion system cytoplasmic ring protein SctQ n=1 Tax=Luteimonas sp. SDU101 TaxID=3422593 RepID=UPI003EBBB215